MKGEKRVKIDKNAAYQEYKQTEEAKMREIQIVRCRYDMT